MMIMILENDKSRVRGNRIVNLKWVASLVAISDAFLSKLLCDELDLTILYNVEEVH